MKGLSVAQCVAWDLAELTSQLLQMPRHRLDPEANLAEARALSQEARRRSDRLRSPPTFGDG